MHCPECAAEVPPLREYCPHCGTPVRASRRERGTGAPVRRSEDELKRNRKLVLIIGAALLATGIATKASWFGQTITFVSHERHRGPMVIEAEQVYDAYRDDAHAAARRFRGREMVVSGEFVRIVPDGDGNPDLRLKTSNPDAPLGADLIQMSYDDSTRLRPGQRVTVSCQRMAGSEQDPWLQNCAIQSATGGSAAPTPPAAPSPPQPPGGADKG